MLVNLVDVLKIAEERKIAVGMFNATGFDSLQAIIKAAEELNEPVIISHAEVHNYYNDISFVGPAMIAAAKAASVPVCVHLDHGVTEEMLDRALEIGFTSIMIDASALPYEQNVEFTKRITDKAHALGVSVEAELGRMPNTETGISHGGNPEDYYTDENEAVDFVKRTGVDALAIAFGTAHGFYKAQPKLDFSVIERVKAATGMPLVMHGGSGVSDEGFKQAVRCGIRKINYYSYMSKAGYEAAAKVIAEDSTSYLHDVEYAAMLAMKEDVKRAIKVFTNK